MKKKVLEMKKNKLFTTIFIFLLVATTFQFISNEAKAQDTDPDPDHVRFVHGMMRSPGGALGDLDPHYAWYFYASEVFDQVVEPLYAVDFSDPELGLVPRLASADGTWSEGGLVFTVPLRTVGANGESITFHDGESFDADAVVTNFERLFGFLNPDPLDPIPPGPPMFAQLFHWPDGTPIISEVESIGGDVVFTLSRPYAPFKSLLSISGILSPNPASTPQDSYIDITVDSIVGTGPFVFDEYIEDDEVRFHGYDEYWQGEPNIDELIFKILPDDAERVSALDNGEVDFISQPGINPDILKIIRYNSELSLVDAGTISTSWNLGMNNVLIPNPMREAISHALDYERIIQEVMYGEAERLRSPIPQGILYAKEYDVPNGDEFAVFHARAILRESGLYGDPNPEDLPLPEDNEGWEGLELETYKFYYWWGEYDLRMAYLDILSESLRRIGVSLDPEYLPWTEYMAIAEGQKDLLELFLMGWSPDFNDPSNVLDGLFTEFGLNPAQIDDADMNLKALQAVQMYDNPGGREGLYDEIQQILVDSFSFCWLYTARNYDAYNHKFEGFQSNSMDRVWFYSVYQLPIQDPEPVRFVYGVRRSPGSALGDLDPHYNWYFYASEVFDQVIEPLYVVDFSDPELGLVPRLASTGGTWSDGGLTFTVPLRTVGTNGDPITFHDGEIFDANAVVTNFERLFDFLNFDPNDPLTPDPSLFAQLYRWPDGTPIISSVENVGGDVVFSLSRPYAPLKTLLSTAGILSPNPASTPENRYIDPTVDSIVGTGPFVFDEYLVDNELRFHGYDEYWQGEPYIDELIFKIITDDTDRVETFNRGKLDFMSQPGNDPNNLQSIRDNSEVTLVDAGTITTPWYLGMNNVLIPNPMREAISHALDYERIIQEVLYGEAERLRSPVPQGILYAKEYDVPDGEELDVIHARTILRESGLYGDPNPEDLPLPEDDGGWEGLELETYKFVYWWGEYDARMAYLDILAESLGRIGVSVDFEQVPYSEVLRRAEEEKDLLELFLMGWGPDFNDPSNVLDGLFTEFGLNPAQIRDADMNLKAVQALEMYNNPIEREGLYDEIQQILVNNYTYCWLYMAKNYDAYSNKFRGFQSNAMDRVWFYGVFQLTLTKDFTFTSDIILKEGESLVVGADGITIDGGEGFKLIGPGSGVGINLNIHSDITIRDIYIEKFDWGIFVVGGSGNKITVNYITKTYAAIVLWHTSGTTITNNIITKNYFGVGISEESTYNEIYLNLFIKNDIQMDDHGSNNLWCNEALGLGNLWSNYWGKDDGSNDRVAGDYIGDTDLPHMGVDEYPLLDPSIIEAYGPLYGADWWLIWRGGWSPIDIQVIAPNGGILSNTQNELGLNAFYVEDEEYDPESKQVMVLIAINPKDPLFGDYSFQMTALEDLTYSMQWFVSGNGERFLERSVEDAPLIAEQTREVAINAELNEEGEMSPSPIPQYTFSGILQPINSDGSSVFKQKCTIPVKFQLLNSMNMPIGTAHATIDIAKISNGVTGFYNEPISTSAADTGNMFRFDEIEQQYVFNLGTKQLETGTYLIKISLDDGQVFTVQVSLK
jgi:peptide/nickel transport system substrate-binding protein